MPGNDVVLREGVDLSGGCGGSQWLAANFPADSNQTTVYFYLMVSTTRCCARNSL